MWNDANAELEDVKEKLQNAEAEVEKATKEKEALTNQISQQEAEKDRALNMEMMLSFFLIVLRG